MIDVVLGFVSGAVVALVAVWAFGPRSPDRPVEVHHVVDGVPSPVPVSRVMVHQGREMTELGVDGRAGGIVLVSTPERALFIDLDGA